MKDRNFRRHLHPAPLPGSDRPVVQLREAPFETYLVAAKVGIVCNGTECMS